MSFRLAAYAVCIDADRVLLARHEQPDGQSNWSLPGGKVEHGEDPFDTVIREVAEETGLEAEVDRLLGVDSRVIPAAQRFDPALPEHHNVGVFYLARILGGTLRPEVDGEVREPAWVPVADVGTLGRSSLVDVGLALARIQPPTGHVDPVPVGGLIRH